MTNGIHGLDLPRNSKGYINLTNNSGPTILAVVFRGETDKGDAATIVSYMLNRPSEPGDVTMLMPLKDLTISGGLVSSLSVDSAVSDIGEFWGSDKQHQFAAMRDRFHQMKLVISNAPGASPWPWVCGQAGTERLGRDELRENLRVSEVFDLKPTSGDVASFIKSVGWRSSRNCSTGT